MGDQYKPIYQAVPSSFMPPHLSPQLPTYSNPHTLQYRMSQSLNFSTQMMQLQLKILQERQKNVALKKLVAQNIIAQSGTHSQQQYFQSPQPMPQLPQHNMLSKHHLEHIRHGVHANNDNMMLQNGDFASVQHKTSAPGNSNSHTNPSHISSSVHSDEGYILNELSKLQSGNQDELAKEDKPRVRFLQAQPNNQKLHSLQEQITSIVQETTKLLSNDVDDQLPFNKRKQKQQRAAHIKHKQDVQSLLRNKNTTSLEILPKWKHMQLKNNSNPPPYTVMKSVRLWRIVAWSLVVMVTTPIVDVYKKKKKFVDRDKKEFKRTLDLFMETFDDYMGKATHVPIHSIVSDTNLDFEIKDVVLQKQKLLQLKVRLKGLVTAVASAALPSPSIITFLVSMISDGTYLPEDFLWSCEFNMLDFDRLGAQRAVLTEVDPILAATVPYKMLIQPPSSGGAEGEEQRPIIVDITRARVILVNFLLIRVLIYRVGLTPWQHGVTAQPANRNIRKTVLNLRVVMTLFYMLLRVINDKLPSLATTNATQESKHAIKGNGLTVGRLLSVKQPHVTIDDQDEQHDEDSGTLDNKAHSVLQESTTGPQGLLKSVLKLAGFADTTPGFEVFKKDSIEFLFLQPKTANYCSFEHLQTLLLPPAYMNKLQAVANDWFDELIPPLSDWAQRLTEHVVQSSYAAKFKQGVEEKSTRAPV